jgi:predicted nucleic acid-binding protein
MSNELILLDTNIIIYILNGNLEIDNVVDDKLGVVSFITEIELLGKKNIAVAETNAIKKFLHDCLSVDYDLSLKRRTILLKSTYGLKLADAFIAATALEFDIPLVSADKVFERVEELNFIKLIPKK